MFEFVFWLQELIGGRHTLRYQQSINVQRCPAFNAHKKNILIFTLPEPCRSINNLDDVYEDY